MDKLSLVNDIKSRIEEESGKETPNKELIKEMVRDLYIHSIGLNNLNINGNFKLIP